MPDINCILSFSALVVYCTKSRRAERYWQKTLLQMEEMESQIREEIRKGVFTRSHTCMYTHKRASARTNYVLCQLTQKIACVETEILTTYICVFVRIYVYVCVCVCKILFLVWSGRKIQQLTDLCLVSVTHKTQCLTNDQSHARRTEWPQCLCCVYPYSNKACVCVCLVLYVCLCMCVCLGH